MSPKSNSQKQKDYRERHRDKHLEACRERYRRRRQNGICNQCGRPHQGLTAVCDDCLKAWKEKR